MSEALPQLQVMLSEAYSLPEGQARMAALDAVIRHADAADEVKFAYDTRMSAMNSYEEQGDTTRLFLAFSWCLSTFDSRPDLFGEGYEHNLLWRFKWVVNGLSQYPEIPLERTETVLEDMQRRWQLGGHSLHAVHQHRWRVAHHIGDLDAAQQWYDRMVAAKRDNLSDCIGCVPTDRVVHLVTVGRYEEALQVGSEVKTSWCWSQPQGIQSAMLYPYLRTGQFDAAAHAHREAYRRMRDKRRHLEDIGSQVWLCGLTGNESRGLEIIERHVPWLDRPVTPFAAMQFAAASAHALGRLRETGQGDMEVMRRDDAGHTRRLSVSALHEELATYARDIAARFDARNGNAYQSQRVASIITAAPFTAQLPLTVLSGFRDKGRDTVAPLVEKVAAATAANDEPAAARARLDVAQALSNAGRWEDAVESAEEALRSLERANLTSDVLRARYLLFQLYKRASHHHGEALSILDVLLAASQLPDNIPSPAVLLEQAADAISTPDMVSRLITAADYHRARDDQAAEIRVLRKALSLRVRAWQYTEGKELLERLDHLDPAPPELATIDMLAARVLAHTDSPAVALTRVGRAIDGFTSVGQEFDVFQAKLLRASLLLAAGDAVASESAARELLTDDADWSVIVAVARALRAQNRPEDLEAFLDEHQIDESDLDYDEDDY